MILITGAAGKTGKTIVKHLLRRGVDIRIWVHHPEQGISFLKDGVKEVISGDLRNRDLFLKACRDIEAIYHICPNMNPQEHEIGRIALEAARQNQVARFIYHSVFHPHIQKMPHHWNKLLVEAEIFKSGLPFTILQPTAYLQNILAYWPKILEDGIYSPPYSPQTRIGMVDLEDVGEAAVKILTDPAYSGGIYELVGTPPLSQAEIGEAISRKIGKVVQVVEQPRGLWEENAVANGMDEYSRRTLLSMFRYYEEFGMWGNPKVLEGILGRQPLGLEAFIERIIREQELKR